MYIHTLDAHLHTRGARQIDDKNLPRAARAFVAFCTRANSTDAAMCAGKKSLWKSDARRGFPGTGFLLFLVMEIVFKMRSGFFVKVKDGKS